ncbi:hypothetical protein EUX98_g4622 [Antrodiella citrinella]|uniref:Uncharacterized protein n=1 Tax=Antrodiella citrinella TaxID=2447956 RepID=A0A4S4MUF5_9APHY|nr:hypothetical protein EUX98_g4622 [Antrodiella citrinella]
MQNLTATREASPSPSFRERQRAMKAHSMPIVPSVGQILSNGSQQQPSPTISNPSRRTPPPTSRISPVTGKLATNSHLASNAREHSPERPNSPLPQLVHAHSQPVVTTLQPSQQSFLAHQPRPIKPPFLQYQSVEEKWQITEELMADFERADQQGQLQGTSGVAYAGGAASTLVHSAVERVRGPDRSSPKDADNNSKRQVTKERDPQSNRESPKTRERSQTVSSVAGPRSEQEVVSQERTEFRASPYSTPMASPGERTAAYSQYVPDSYQSASNPPPRKSTLTSDSPTSRLTPPSQPKASQSPPSQAMNVRVAARSLPVQEEPEEEVVPIVTNEDDYPEQHRSPGHSPDPYNGSHSPRYENHRPHRNGHIAENDDDDEETLNDSLEPQQNKSGEDDDSGFTPRSPSTTLPERAQSYNGTNGIYGSPPTQYTHPAVESEQQKTIRAAKHRSAHSDHLNMRGFDPTVFEQTVSSLRNNPPQQAQEQHSPHPAQQVHPQASHSQQTNGSVRSEPPSQQSHYTNGHYPVNMNGLNAYSSPVPPPVGSPLETLFDDPTSSYLRSFYSQSGSRPRAPIPPTPQSNTAAPSPSPAISAMQDEHIARTMGSPYPYPFTHIRRTAPFTGLTTPSTSYDPNNPNFVREQLALQMQIYALNHGLNPGSDSTFSPSSTPYPGPGYNPWALMQHTPSVRSSPSHEPVPMPSLPSRGRGLRRRGNSHDLRTSDPAGRRRGVIKPPVRVDSTQPRDTSPEPSSGEETAGELEERFVDQYLPNETESVWVDGADGADLEDIGEWVDENDDGEEDLLQLEYHPTYVTRGDKRKRRWETRWDALIQAFQALDRETDTTLILLAAPAHTSKLHGLTSRSIRRDSALLRSDAFHNIHANFNHLAAQRKASRVRRFSLADHLSSAPSTATDGSQSGSDSREEDLRKALEAALGSLGAMGTLYEQREARWKDEMRRISEDREHVELLLRQALGPAALNGRDMHHAPTGSSQALKDRDAML